MFKDPTSISRTYVQEKLNQRIKLRHYDSLKPFPALSAILSVRGYTGLAALLVESLGEPV